MRIEDDVVGWLSNGEKFRKQKVIASRWVLKQQFRYRADVEALNSAVDSLTEDELEWLARESVEGYADSQKRMDFFEQRAILLEGSGRSENVE
ncbi:MAG TPA: hypothetical protein DCM05_09105 [Elusimicrobia bacterium]|nr:hypothetical protein [Elusimicrobiota bacterium]